MTNKPYDENSAESIITYAKHLKNQSLKSACGSNIETIELKGNKGSFGQLLEKLYFGYEPNSNAEADFPEAGLELKASPLKTLKNGDIRSKERLVLNIINYLEVHKEDFENSTFLKKNAYLLLVFYLYEKDTHVLDYIIRLVDDWKYPEEDLAIIRHDWETINKKIKDGKAHELSEGDTFYLGACTKGTTAEKSLREQPFNTQKAKQRAYSLKQGYVNHIIANISKNETKPYGKIIKTPNIIIEKSIEEIILEKFQPFYGKTPEQIEQHFNLELNRKAKSYFANLTNQILGLELNQKIAEFEKADIQVKTVRLNENNLPKEHISFPTFKYREIIETSWDESDVKEILSNKFFFVFYKQIGNDLVLKKVTFWNMSCHDLNEVEGVWKKTVDTITKGNIVAEIKNGRRQTNFPKATDNRIAHVRPHARNADDTYDLPTKDKVSGLTSYTKHCFWLNANYVKDEIYLKT